MYLANPNKILFKKKKKKEYDTTLKGKYEDFT